MKRTILSSLAAIALVSGCGSAQTDLQRGIALWDARAKSYRDGPKAAQYFERACGKGSADACNRAGVVYNGEAQGLTRDEPKAMALFEKACKLGNSKACANAAWMLWAGKGVPKDRLRACQLLENACPAESSACDAIQCVWRGKDIGFAPGGLLRKLDERCKSPEAKGASCFDLALTYAFGAPDVPADPLRGVDYAQRVMEATGNPRLLALLVARGVGVSANPARAEQLLRSKCDAGNASGACHQMRTLRAGNDSAAAEAAIFHKRQCDENSSVDCWLLARLLMHGYGVTRDSDAAHALLTKTCTDRANPMICSDLREGFLESFPPMGTKPSTQASVSSTTPVAQPGPSARPQPASAGFMPGTPQPTTYAVIIGIERYRELPAPTGARADAEQFANVARLTLGVRPENMKIALDDRATHGDIDKLLEWAKSSVPQGGRLLFFYSGHGGPDASQGTPYLIPYDGDPAYLERTGIPLAHVMETLQQSRAKEAIAFVDSCFSGAGGRSVLPKGARPLVKVKATAAQGQVSLLSAASGAEISGPTADAKGGLFSQMLIEGLGRARADANGDGQISLRELTEYVRPRVQRLAAQQNRTQNPALTVGAGAGDPVIAFGLATH